jgi:membrane protein implicated in regulation of membrane protease activity
LGNPLKSEGAAFRWLVAVVAGAALVILVALLMSSVAAALLGFILMTVVAVFIVRGMAHMLGSPEGDQDPPVRSDPMPDSSHEDRDQDSV